MDNQLEKIRKAYNTVSEQQKKGIDPLSMVPEDFRKTEGFKELMERSGPFLTGSCAPEYKEYLSPGPGMRLLDIGSCANLANYRLDLWGSKYYGIDISNDLILAMHDFARTHHLSIGGLCIAEMARLPFRNDFFDMAAVIGVFEYCNLGYSKQAFSEVHRVLRPEARMVLDLPNEDHPHVPDMFRLEEYLGRPNIPKTRISFEKILSELFEIDNIDDSLVMIKYFVRAVK